MTGAHQDAPLASVLFFTYDQAEFVEEAAAAALAQRYRPLEVVWVDDHSTDDTILRAERVFSKSPDDVTVRRVHHVENRGFAEAFNSATEAAAGDVLVSFSGDDVSSPDRVTVSVDVLRSSLLFQAGAAVIDEDGTVRGDYWPRRPGERRARWHPAGPLTTLGAALAFHRSLIDGFPSLAATCWNEDRILAFRAWLLGTSRFVPESLVRYRIHDDNMHFKELRNAWRARKVTSRLLVDSRRELAVRRQEIRDIEYLSGVGTDVPIECRRAAHERLELAETVERFAGASWSGALLQLLSGHLPARQALRVVLQRWAPRAFVFLSYIRGAR